MARWGWVALRVPQDANRGSREMLEVVADTSLGRARGTTWIAWSKNGPFTEPTWSPSLAARRRRSIFIKIYGIWGELHQVLGAWRVENLVMVTYPKRWHQRWQWLYCICTTLTRYYIILRFTCKYLIYVVLCIPRTLLGQLTNRKYLF
jgi:hypothetical protein